MHRRGAGGEESAEGVGRVIGEVVADDFLRAGAGLAVALKGLGAEVSAGVSECVEEIGHRAFDLCVQGEGLGGLCEGDAGGEEGEGCLGVAQLRGGEGDGVAEVLCVDPGLCLGEGFEAGAAAAVGEVDGGVVPALVGGAGDGAVAVVGRAGFHDFVMLT